MRVCFIGDSHLACIKKAWDAQHAGRNPDIAATFFAVPGKGIGHLEVRDGALSSDLPPVVKSLTFVSGGHDRIDASYEVYALHAMHLGIVTALEALRAAGGAPRPKFVASAEYRAALREAIGNSIALATLRKLRRITRAPAIVAPMPLADVRLRRLRERLAQTRAAARLGALFNEECGLACRSLDAVFVPQPPQTLGADGLGTKAEYSAGPARFSRSIEEAAQEDPAHMNIRYGVEMGAAMLDAISSSYSAATNAAL